MPQVETATFVSQILWLAVTFAILYLVMARIALPRIGEVLEARQDRIAHDLDTAASLKAEAEAALAAYETSIAEARAQAQSVLARAAEERAAAEASRRAEFDARIAKRLRGAEARIAAAKRDALGSVAELAGEIARAATAKLIGVEPGDDEVKAALAQAAEPEA